MPVYYRFLRNPTELKNIKNISLLRQQMSPTRPAPPQMIGQLSSQLTVKPEPADTEQPINVIKPVSIKNEEYEDRPTDLSMEGPTDLSTNNRHVNIVCSPDTPQLREPPPHYYTNTTNEEK